MAMAELSRLKADLSLVSLMRASNDAGHENHPVPASPSSAPSSPRARGNDGEPEIRGGHGGAGGAGHNGTGGPAISSFFMVVLLFGLMMPEVKLFQSSSGSQGLLSLTSTHLQHKAESPPYFEKSQTDMENDLWQRLGELTTFSAVKRKRKRGDVGMVWKMASEIPSANGCTDEEKVNNKATTLNPSETDAELIITRVQDAFVQVMRDAVADTHRLTGKWTCLYFFKLAHRHLQTLPKEEVVAVGGRVNEKLNKWKGTGERGRGRGVLEAVREIVLTAEGRMMMSDLKIQEQQLIASFSAVSA